MSMTIITDIASKSNGFFKFPIALVKEYGQTSQALAALWNLSEIRTHNLMHAGLPHVARLAGMKLITVKRQVARLQRIGAIKRMGSHQATPTVTTARYALAGDIWEQFQKRSDFLQVPKEWQGFTFTEKILLAYYRFKCGLFNYSNSFCLESLASIAETLGFDRGKLGKASESLEACGAITRQHTPRGNFAISIPGHEPAIRLLDVLAGKSGSVGESEYVEPTDDEQKDNYIDPTVPFYIYEIAG